jgi:hypothetical protein
MAVLAKRIDWPTEIRLEGAETGAPLFYDSLKLD